MTRLFIFSILVSASIALYAQNSVYDSYIRQADSLFMAGEYETAAQTFSDAFQTLGWRGYPADRFDAAKAWVKAGNSDSAFFHLQRLIEKTDFLDDESRLTLEPDFEPLHNDLRWSRLQTLLFLKKDRREALRNDPLALELERMYTLDQWYRIHWDSVIALHGRKSPEFADFLRRNREQDSLNVVRMAQILDEQGWPGPDEVGEKGSKAVFLVIQHADLPVQEKYLPAMRKAVAEGKAEASNLAYLEDRVLMRQGKPQRYGSQVIADKQTGAWVLHPVEDPENLDKRRAAVGLGPIKDYLEMMGATWNQ